MISSSNERNSFSINTLLQKVETGEKTADAAEEMIEFYNSHLDQVREQEADPKWREHNLEYDLRATDWIVTKARANECYAQNLYAAMCNNKFRQNAVWPLLKNQIWFCSWRYAGGIVADMLGRGGYMDWYCSGIRNSVTDDEYAAMTEQEQEQWDYYENNFVGESHVTEEIRTDLFQLGWTVVDNEDEINI